MNYSFLMQNYYCRAYRPFFGLINKHTVKMGDLGKMNSYIARMHIDHLKNEV